MSITSGVLLTHHNPLFNKQIHLNDINKVIKRNDSYILKSPAQTIKMDITIITKESAKTLKTIIEFIEQKLEDDSFKK